MLNFQNTFLIDFQSTVANCDYFLDPGNLNFQIECKMSFFQKVKCFNKKVCHCNHYCIFCSRHLRKIVANKA